MTDELREKVSRILESARPTRPCTETPAWQVSGSGHLVAGGDINIINSTRKGLSMNEPRSQTRVIRWVGSLAAVAVATGGLWWFQVGKQEAWAKTTVRDRLTDPGSALFRNLHEAGRGQICGEVNAKNAMGGYTGFRRFVATNTKESGSWATIEALEAEVHDEARANQVAVSMGQTTSRERLVAREVFASLGSSCQWN